MVLLILGQVQRTLRLGCSSCCRRSRRGSLGFRCHPRRCSCCLPSCTGSQLALPFRDSHSDVQIITASSSLGPGGSPTSRRRSQGRCTVGLSTGRTGRICADSSRFPRRRCCRQTLCGGGFLEVEFDGGVLRRLLRRVTLTSA